MSRTLSRITGSGSGGVIAAGDFLTLTVFDQKVKHNLDMLMLGTLCQNVPVAGSREQAFEVHADGDIRIPETFPFRIDNSNGQFSGFTDANSAVLVAQFRFLLRVSDAAISITPKMFYGTTISNITNAATQSGATACSATASDFLSSNQYQSVGVTLPSGIKLWEPWLTVSGTGGLSYNVYAKVVADIYIQS